MVNVACISWNQVKRRHYAVVSEMPIELRQNNIIRNIQKWF
jgi:hypothetical protein